MTSSTDGVAAFLRGLAGRLARWMSRPLEGLLGPVDSWIRHRELKAAPRSVGEALEAVRARTDPSTLRGDGAAPVFVLATSWRSGSTLVQRLITAGGEVLVWGEPYARAAYIRRMAGALRPVTGEYPPDDFFRDDLDPDGLAGAWIANLYPPLEDLIAAHRAFFEELYASEARAAGYGRWGLKSVHLDGDHARYLKTLFPDGDVVVLVRDPYQAFRSYRRWLEWYDRWPDEPVFTVTRFGELWQKRTESLLDAADEVDALVLRYEDLASDEGEAAVHRLSRHLGARVPADVLEEAVPARGAPRPKLDRLPLPERLLLAREVSEVRSRLGYGS